MISAARRNQVLAVLVTLAAWEVVGRNRWIGDGAFPSLTSIFRQFWKDRTDYPVHIASTSREAFIGFVAGNLVALVLAIVFAFIPIAERLLRGIVVALFCLPLTVVAPIIGLAYRGDTPKYVLAAMAVYFPTLTATLVGLRSVNPGASDVIRSVGGGSRQIMLRLRIRTALPGLLAGLRVAAPGAMLGAMLGEFLGGHHGLGVYLLGSLGQANPARLWDIGIVATLISVAVYGVFAVIGRSVSGASIDATVATSISADLLATGDLGGRTPLSRIARRLGVGVVAFAVTLGGWMLFRWSSRLPHTIAKSPMDVIHYLTTGPAASRHRHSLTHALLHTLGYAGIGFALGLTAAFVLATVLSLRPAVASAIMPFAFISQTMPIIALVPIIAIVFSRGLTSTLMITVSVTFFPSFVAITQGLALAPKGAMDVVRSVAGSPWQVLSKVNVPNALPYLFAAARLAAPRALLGVILAEQYITREGIGDLIGRARGELDYYIPWAVAAVVALVSVALYSGIGALEHRQLRRRLGR
jgi:ABC-type nitrate/sulfonate/bicarbonate transport system permease component